MCRRCFLPYVPDVPQVSRKGPFKKRCTTHTDRTHDHIHFSFFPEFYQLHNFLNMRFATKVNAAVFAATVIIAVADKSSNRDGGILSLRTRSTVANAGTDTSRTNATKGGARLEDGSPFNGSDRRSLVVDDCPTHKKVTMYKFCIEGDCDAGSYGESCSIALEQQEKDSNTILVFFWESTNKHLVPRSSEANQRCVFIIYLQVNIC